MMSQLYTALPKCALSDFTESLKSTVGAVFTALKMAGAFLVVQWLRIHLPMKGTQV